MENDHNFLLKGKGPQGYGNFFHSFGNLNDDNLDANWFISVNEQEKSDYVKLQSLKISVKNE